MLISGPLPLDITASFHTRSMFNDDDHHHDHDDTIGQSVSEQQQGEDSYIPSTERAQHDPTRTALRTHATGGRLIMSQSSFFYFFCLWATIHGQRCRLTV